MKKGSYYYHTSTRNRKRIDDTVLESANLKKLSPEEIKLMQDLFFEYQNKGLPSNIALQKATSVIKCFRKR